MLMGNRLLVRYDVVSILRLHRRGQAIAHMAQKRLNDLSYGRRPREKHVGGRRI